MATNKPETESRTSKVEPLAKRIMRIAAALQFIARGVDAVGDEGNADLPAISAAGFAATCNWAAVELEKLSKELPSEGER